MSTHPIPSPQGDTEDSLRWQRLEQIRRLVRAAPNLREPEGITDDGTTLSLVFTPDLTAGQTTTLGRIIAYSGIMRITPQEYQALEPDVDGLKTYLGVATPTAAQTAAATKAIIRVLAALLRS